MFPETQGKISQINNNTVIIKPAFVKAPVVSNGPEFSVEGLVVPKKPANPCVNSPERMNLHKELLFNQKIGKNVLTQKSELAKAIEKRQDDQKKREKEKEKAVRRNSFEKRLQEQALKLEENEKQDLEKEKEKEKPEFFKIHAKVRHQVSADTNDDKISEKDNIHRNGKSESILIVDNLKS